jgi:hypothetical protein
VDLYLHSPYTPPWRGAQLKDNEISGPVQLVSGSKVSLKSVRCYSRPIKWNLIYCNRKKSANLKRLFMITFQNSKSRNVN